MAGKVFVIHGDGIREKRDYGAGDETGGSMTEVPKKGYGSVFSLLVLVGVALG